MELKFPKLTASEMEVRIGQVRKEGATLLLYKDSRCDQRILDEVVGPMNWQRDHKEIKGVLYGGVGIWDQDKGQWVWKWDAGSESNIEAQKGEASDSFKRACFNWGLGRELYTAPDIFCRVKTVEDGKKGSKTIYRLDNPYEFTGAYVSDVFYEGDRIAGVEITKGTAVIWTNIPKGKKNAPQAKPAPQAAPVSAPIPADEDRRAARTAWILEKAQNADTAERIILLDFNINTLNDLTDDDFKNVVERIKKGEL